LLRLTDAFRSQRSIPEILSKFNQLTRNSGARDLYGYGLQSDYPRAKYNPTRRSTPMPLMIDGRDIGWRKAFAGRFEDQPAFKDRQERHGSTYADTDMHRTGMCKAK